jgi:hypothetical protein
VPPLLEGSVRIKARGEAHGLSFHASIAQISTTRRFRHVTVVGSFLELHNGSARGAGAVQALERLSYNEMFKGG